MNKMKTLFHTSGMRALVAAGALVAGLGFAATASATLTASVGGVPTGASLNYESFDSCTLGPSTCAPSSGLLSVVFTPDAQAVQGASPGLYAAPFLSNSNGSLFGDPAVSGADTTTYLTSGSDTGSAGAAVTLNFTNPERYMGLLWGSVDAYNTLTFYSGANGTGTATVFTGGDISGVAGTGNCVGGNQGALGTCYVNINLSSTFLSVVATSSDYAFEFDNVAFSSNTIGVPEPGVVSMFLLGLLLLGSGYWFKKREHRVS